MNVCRKMTSARMQCSPSRDLPRHTATKFLDVISTLSGRAGQPSDAVSAHTRVKMEDAPKRLGSSK